MSASGEKSGDFKWRTFTAWLLLAACLLAVWPLQNSIDRERGSGPDVMLTLLTGSGKRLRQLCLGYDGLLADIYWTRAVQYFGRSRLKHADVMPLLGPLLNLATDLDPHLLIAYRFGAIFLAERAPLGAGEPQAALQLLRKGIVANPGYWRLWQDLGFVYYWDLRNYPAASRAFLAGSEQPGAMIWMKTLAAAVAAQGGEDRTSAMLWEQIYLHPGNDEVRRSAADHLAALRAQTELRQLNVLIERYRQRQGRWPDSFAALIVAGYLREIPRDPSGAPYVIGKDGKAALSKASKVDLSLAH